MILLYIKIILSTIELIIFCIENNLEDISKKLYTSYKKEVKIINIIFTI